MDSSSSYFNSDTIVAVATIPGSPLGIIRISGPESKSVLSAITPKKSILHSTSNPKQLTRTYFVDQKKRLDDGFLVYFEKDKSFTGEAGFELYLHGGGYNLFRILKKLIDSGARQALPGEFSFRSVRNGKQSITQAEAIHDLITAENEAATTLALEKMEGAQHKVLIEVSDKIRKLAAMSELGIDFSDQDVPELSLNKLQNEIDSIVNTLQKLSSSFERGTRIQHGIQLVLLGAPNVGKSSLFNVLLSEDRAIVSEEAGTTRDILKETLNLKTKSGECTLRLIDTAGIRKSNQVQKIEAIGIKKTFQVAEEADLILVLSSYPVDPEFLKNWKIWISEVEKNTDQEKDCQKTNRLENIAEKTSEKTSEKKSTYSAIFKKCIGVLTKSDEINESEIESARVAMMTLFGIEQCISTSALNLIGIEELAEAIIQKAKFLLRREAGEIVLTRVGQVRAIDQALISLERAKLTETEDLFAADLRHALSELAPVIGETSPDDILTKIFSEFCIGK